MDLARTLSLLAVPAKLRLLEMLERHPDGLTRHEAAERLAVRHTAVHGHLLDLEKLHAVYWEPQLPVPAGRKPRRRYRLSEGARAWLAANRLLLAGIPSAAPQAPRWESPVPGLVPSVEEGGD